ncbi:hypothetical protein COJ96_13540 [Bacillus sp. AFS073361]|uniref:hypothetical protein n=1 Tax=Bacillus sp. AFS073361 TaxID=2033511 RepID=UPI000BF56115|nr:hypothetical protein [Bacillus sp. AFS073361]PFP28712.1 hypothetical protein COJ96_13540 [Bacillus sp. AFS073361]
MSKITTTEEIAAILASFDHPLAPYWLNNDLIKKTIATSYDYWVEDTDIPMSLADFVFQYLEHAEYLGGIFSNIHDPS